jgi:cytochrome P450
LKQDPSKVPAAVLEGVRHNAAVRFFSRVAAQDYEVDGIVIPKGARVLMLYGSANRDERHYENPDRFDIDRDPRDQLAWGTGAHMCAGMHLARLEMEVMLEALIEADAEISLVALPAIGTNRALYGYENLPLQLGVKSQSG